jgi:hypothetical protein
MFMITDLRVHHPDLGVHVALILAFTFDRSGRSRWAGARTDLDARFHEGDTEDAADSD